ncbi:CPBP family intramembrane glutamic endopeptidase [Streptococcus sp. Marseille-P7376]|uniref:CPBP family intramembrane glutamic endopeptidase n=1 Tax=Streptococcus sp. Marseille-P7376 TaxID=2592044 RepID=UPI0011E73E00|nr:type II CAAX endopeptidase family protein [Streptococcus sp. Marseille-P7376]
MPNFAKIDKKFVYTTIIGLFLMAVLSLTKIIPELSVSGLTVLIGTLFFFVLEYLEKKSNIESGLHFKSFFNDLKKQGVILLVLLPIGTAVVTLIIGDLVFKGAFTSHIVGRTDSMLSFDKIPLLMVQVIIAALGEEIAWRGFFLGKSMTIFPFWLCAIVSSLLFAIAHISSGSVGLVSYDIFMIFVDSIIYAMIYKKSGNCLISTLSHILGNATGILLLMMYS